MFGVPAQGGAAAPAVPNPQPYAAPANPRATQMFGMPAITVPPQQAPGQTFGAAPPVQPYGSVTAGPQPAYGAPAAGGSPQMFGAPAQPAQPQGYGTPSHPGSTQMFGTPAVGMPAQPAQPQGYGTPAHPGSTQMFGSPAVAAQPAPAPGQAPRAATQMFGNPFGGAQANPHLYDAPADATLPGFGGPPIGQPVQPIQVVTQPRGNAGSRPVTPMFGAPAQAPGAANAHLAATVLDGPPDPAQTSPRSTMMFGMQAVQVPAAAPGSSTMLFGGQAAQLQAPAPTPVAPAPAPVPAPAAKAGVSDLDADDPAAAFRAQHQRRNRTFAVVALVGALGLAGFAAFKTIGKRRPQLSAALAGERDAALALLRRDDSVSLKQAGAQLTALAEKNPPHFELRAAEVLALSLQLDDARLELHKLQNEADELNKKINRMKETRTPGDWENRVNAMVDRVGGIKKATDPLVEDAAALDTEVGNAFRAMTAAAVGEVSPAQELELVRAQAVYFGVKGGDQAIRLSDKYQALAKEADDGWGTIARAEFAANSRVTPETVAASRTALEALRAKDSTFLRAYALAARLALNAKQKEAATTALAALLTLNPKHTVATKLLAWSKQDVEPLRASAPSP